MPSCICTAPVKHCAARGSRKISRSKTSPKKPGFRNAIWNRSKALPGRTYAIGFAKSYARTVGLVDASIGSQLRAEMDEQGHEAYQPEVSGYAPANPSSIPPRYLAWTAAGIGALVLIGYLVWRTLILNPGDLEQIAESETTTSAETAATSASDQKVADMGPVLSNQGTVVLTATEPVWMKIYDAEGERLFENEMAAGETFTVPADANEPDRHHRRPGCPATGNRRADHQGCRRQCEGFAGTGRNQQSGRRLVV